MRKVSVENDRHLPQTPPLTPARSAGTSPHDMRVSSARLADVSGIEPQSQAVPEGVKSASKVSLSVKGEYEESFKRSTGERAVAAVKMGKKNSPENIFLLDVGAMMEKWKKGSSKGELANSGAWWRLSYRNNRDLMQRVLAETIQMVKEGTIKTNPGATAVDIHNRWK